MRGIRPYRTEDENAVLGVWYRSGRTAYPYLVSWQSLKLETAREAFRNAILSRCRIWVGTTDDRIVAFLAMDGSTIDRMYVHPAEWRRGWGTRLVEFAKSLSPEGLELYTHEENFPARRLYEKLGFQAVRFGVSPPPESAPDVEYHWRPETKE